MEADKINRIMEALSQDFTAQQEIIGLWGLAWQLLLGLHITSNKTRVQHLPCQEIHHLNHLHQQMNLECLLKVNENKKWHWPQFLIPSYAVNRDARVYQ